MHTLMKFYCKQRLAYVVTFNYDYLRWPIILSPGYRRCWGQLPHHKP